jgi:hypothetical protein
VRRRCCLSIIRVVPDSIRSKMLELDGIYCLAHECEIPGKRKDEGIMTYEFSQQAVPYHLQLKWPPASILALRESGEELNSAVKPHEAPCICCVSCNRVAKGLGIKSDDFTPPQTI